MSAICLASRDPDSNGRISLLNKANREYPWDHTFIPNYSMLYEPGTEHPKLWQALTAGMLDGVPKAEIPQHGGAYLEMRQRTGLPPIKRLISDRIRDFLGSFANGSPLHSPKSYENLFGDSPPPAAAKHWADDDFFAWQRLAGPNPVMLQQLSSPPAEFAIDDDRLPGALTLSGLVASGALYLCDYAYLEGIPRQVHDGTQVHAPPAKALFAMIDGRLQPLAIQLGQSAAPSTVFTPADGTGWTMAKLVVQTADLNVHELITHLARTHFTLEGVAVATSRTLSCRHPIHALLWPHLRFLIFNNFEGRELLLNPTGWASELLAGGMAGNLELLERSRLGYPERDIPPWDIDNWHLPKELAARGVDNPEQLPDYPFRDDGLLIWKEIGVFVREYVQHFFVDDATVRDDEETQSWARELASSMGAGLRGVSGQLADREALSDLLHRILWASGPLHSAVNYPQYEYMSFVPNMPAGLYDAPWQRSETVDAASIMKMLPPPEQASLQLFTVKELTSCRYDRLGHYPTGSFPHEVMPIITRFQAALERASRVIEDADAARPWRYPYLHPARILNSTSI